MKKISVFAAILACACSCQSLKEEFQPVFTFGYENPEPAKVWSRTEVENTYGSIITIADLASRYTTGKSWNMDEDLVITGIVSTTDKPGNFYKSFYIQDATGGMEIKIGKNGLYNDYLPGQRVYVVCNGLTLGMYGYKSGNYGGIGMVQVGASRNVKDDGTFADDYETSYMENAVVIDTHVLKGEVEGEVVPAVISESDLPNAQSDTQKTNKYVGSLVTLKGLKYADEVFCLLYLDSNRDKKASDNRIFLSDTNGIDAECPTHQTVHGLAHGVTTWAMSKAKMTEYLCMGCWDGCRVGSGNEDNFPRDAEGNFITVGSLKGPNGKYEAIEKAAYSVSQYFKMGGTEIQIRTSGYSKFADREIPAEVLSGAKTIDVTGVITLYQGSIQLTVNNISDFVVDGKPLE
ncbi:MAG: hypothetical protein KBS55_01370 [Bacteroidales bacterium]|nr:hypothetical protein [Candidatus Cryptobacteroides aphodequi]